ncbi:MAG: hypothetical protein U0790_12175 [Isosphaeraceae bacterium]
MPLYELTANDLRPIQETTFASAQIREREDLQRLLRERIEVICPETLVLTEEFCDWQDSYRRIDLLGLDKEANLVVIELKRTEDGGHMELQAIRYAAMVSTMTFTKAAEVHGQYLARLGRSDDPRETILGFLGWEEPDDSAFAQDVRIVLVSSDFHPEISTTVLWLNQRGLDIRCIRIRPYKLDDRLIVDVQPIIPLPEAQEYQVRIRGKAGAERESREQSTRQWDEKTLMTTLEEKWGPEVRNTSKAILDWVTPRVSYVWWGRGKIQGSFIPVLLAGERQYQLFAIWTNGFVEVQFHALSNKPAFAEESNRMELRDRLQKIEGVEIPLDRLNKRPGIDLDYLTDPANLALFFSAFEWALEHIRKIEGLDETET